MIVTGWEKHSTNTIEESELGQGQYGTTPAASNKDMFPKVWTEEIHKINCQHGDILFVNVDVF